MIPAEPSKLAEPDTSPESAIALAVDSEVAVPAFPFKDAVIVPALKFPDASLATIVEFVLLLVAFEVTVKVLIPDWFAVNVAEPLKPVPDVASVSVPSFAGSTEVVDTAVINPFPLTVIVGILLPFPNVPTLLLTVARVVTVLAEVISPERLGIFVVVVAVPALPVISLEIVAGRYASPMVPALMLDAFL